MPTLRELQGSMMSVLLDCSPPPATEALSVDAGDAQFLSIHRNNIAAGFERSLRSTFPVIARLVGDDYFVQLSRGLQRRSPSRSGDLLGAGEHLPAYLAELHATDQYPYLADVARLEWSCQESLLGAAHEALDLRKLAGAASEHHDALIFVAHPTLRFVESRFPILRIWQANAQPGEHAETIDLAGGGDALLLLRPRANLEFHRLDAGEREFVSGILEGSAFATLVERCHAADPRFDATAALRRLVGIEAIVDCRW